MLNTLDSPFALFDKPHACLKKFLIELGASNIFSICIKDIPTKKVCLNNAVCGKFWGLPGNQMQGMTAREILMRVDHFSDVEHVLKCIEEREQWAIKHCRSTLFEQVLLSYDGYVQVRQSIIIPLNGIRNRIIATGDIGLDITPYVDPLRLLTLYSYYYPKRSKAVAKFSTYFGLAHYFYKPLSYEELRLLLTMLIDCRYKQIAERLKLSSKTVANYLFSMRTKLKEGFELQSMVGALHAKIHANVKIA